MGDKTGISWTDATWNPIVGCSTVSAGCANCYAMRDAHRLASNPNAKVANKYKGLTKVVKQRPIWTGKTNIERNTLGQPTRWQRPRLIFVCSMGDLFHKSVPDEWIELVLMEVASNPRHTFQVLTKRAERMQKFMTAYTEGRGGAGPLPNLWLGVSAEDQKTAEERIPFLLATPAVIRFVSCEPLLGPIDFSNIGNALFDRKRAIKKAMCGAMALNRDQADSIIGSSELDWIIVGGESGPNSRLMDLDWARDILKQCKAASVAFKFKQTGAEWARLNGLSHTKGGNSDEWPEELRVEEFPTTL